MDKRGFSLVELMVVTAILSIISVLGWVALRTSSQQSALASAQALAQNDVRAVAMLLSEELEVASAADRENLNPPVEGVQVHSPCVTDVDGLLDNGGSSCKCEVVFQRPPEVTGAPWEKVWIRYINEDTDGDGELDSGEDFNGDGRLTRGFYRISDRNGDGSVSQSGDKVLLGSSDNISAATFGLSADRQIVTIALTAERPVAGVYKVDEGTGEKVPATVQSEIRTDVYMLN